MSPIRRVTPAVEESENSLLLKDKTELEEPELVLVSGAPAMCSTPLRLDVIEDQNDIDERFDVKNVGISMFEEEGTALFNGATTSVESFVDEFHSISDKHKFSKSARQDLLKLIAKSLPVPNNLFAMLSTPFLPTVSTTNFDTAKLCFVDIRSQVEKILHKNSDYILSSWSESCSWATSWDNFKKPEIQLVLNIDGAPVFKSSKYSVWPIWAQLYNLPPKLRGAFSNLSLLEMWHGKTKPDFSELLPRIVFELESLFDAQLEIAGLGVINFWIRSIVADMPATACILCMNQFNGYSSCPHCYIKGFSQNRRMLFSARKPFVLREESDFKACGKIAKESNIIQYGVKTATPLGKIIILPWNCPIDPMHQIFLGTGKTLSKLIVSLVKGRWVEKAANFLTKINVPFDMQHRTKSLSDIQFWKAFDYKMFFFHIAPLVFNYIAIGDSYFESFIRLCLATRLLSKVDTRHEDICEAEKLIKLFFDNFVDLYGPDSQSFNFHTMRHLCEQVKRNGPLWCFSAFCFESANHGLLSAVQGTVKEPEAIVEQFVKHQASFDKMPVKNSEKYLKGFTVLSEDVENFCGKDAEFFFSRYISAGKCFASLSYSRIGINLSECVFQLKDLRFFRVDSFFSKSGEFFAVGKAAKYVQEYKPAEVPKTFGFF